VTHGRDLGERSGSEYRLTGMRRLAALVVSLLAVVAGCGGDNDSDPDPPEPPASESLEGREFIGTEVSGHELVAGSEVWLNFADGQLGANAGCNTLSGSYTLDGSTIVIEQMAGTEMACEPALMEQDAWLTEFLTSRPSYTLEAETLIVTAGGTSITLTDREVFNPDRPLEGTRWTVDTLYTGRDASGSAASVPAEPEAFLEFDGTTVTGSGGCNSLNGPATVGEGTIAFGPIATTRMACPEGAMDLEAHVLAVLDGEVTYTIDGDVLTLTNEAAEAGLGLRAPPAG
jgi:heat shock protein HslJ